MPVTVLCNVCLPEDENVQISTNILIRIEFAPLTPGNSHMLHPKVRHQKVPTFSCLLAFYSLLKSLSTV